MKMACRIMTSRSHFALSLVLAIDFRHLLLSGEMCFKATGGEISLQTEASRDVRAKANLRLFNSALFRLGPIHPE